jgi:hypothetical protein
MLRCDFKWQQGSILFHNEIKMLSLGESLESNKCAVVISHDCDLSSDVEKGVEVIIGLIIPKSEKIFENARHPRCLHLKFSTPEGESKYIELRHGGKQQISKQQLFAEIEYGDQRLIIAADEKRTLKQRLAARYGRPAFPNAFETRLRKEVRGKKVEQQIEKILALSASHLIGLFFDLGKERFVELAEGEPYFLSISVVYDAIEGGQLARENAEKVVASLKSLFEKAYGSEELTTEIALEACSAVADTFMTLADLRRVDQWRLEYISLRERPVGDFLAAGRWLHSFFLKISWRRVIFYDT